MCYGFSNYKTIVSNNNIFNISNIYRKFLLLILIIAFFIFNPSFFIAFKTASATNENGSVDILESELENQIKENIFELDFNEFEDIYNNTNLDFDNIISDLSLKDFLFGLISGDSIFDASCVGEMIKSEFIKLLRNIISPLLLIFVIVLLCNFIANFKSERMAASVSEIIYFVALSIIIIITSVLIKNSIELSKDTISSISKQINTIFPIMISLMTTIGATTSVKLFNPILSFFSVTIVNLYQLILYPIFIFILICIIVSKLTKKDNLSKMQGFFSSLFKWLIGGGSTLFLTILSFQGITTGIKDGLSLKAAKFAIKNYIPFLGGYISEGFEIVKASSVLLKNAVGFLSVLILVLTVLKPILYLCVLMLGLKFVAASCEIVDGFKISNFIYEISNALKYLIAIIIGISCIYFFIIFLFVSTGNMII